MDPDIVARFDKIALGTAREKLLRDCHGMRDGDLGGVGGPGWGGHGHGCLDAAEAWMRGGVGGMEEGGGRYEGHGGMVGWDGRLGVWEGGDVEVDVGWRTVSVYDEERTSFGRMDPLCKNCKFLMRSEAFVLFVVGVCFPCMKLHHNFALYTCTAPTYATA